MRRIFARLADLSDMHIVTLFTIRPYEYYEGKVRSLLTERIEFSGSLFDGGLAANGYNMQRIRNK